LQSVQVKPTSSGRTPGNIDTYFEEKNQQSKNLFQILGQRFWALYFFPFQFSCNTNLIFRIDPKNLVTTGGLYASIKIDHFQWEAGGFFGVKESFIHRFGL
jgi:hypothetical protein